MEYIEVSGKTVDEALTNALVKLETTSDKVEYEVVSKGSNGFLGIGAKPAVIRARRKQESAESAAESIIKNTIKTESPVKKEEKQTAPEKKEEVKSPVEETKVQEVKPESKTEVMSDEEIERRIRTFLADMFKAMDMEVEVKINFNKKDECVDVELLGNNMGVLIGKRGQTLDSIQYLISLVVNKGKEKYVRIKVDTENYRNRRKETLENLAKNIAYKVKRSKHPVSLEPMNPYERRIIHAALQNDKYVSTRSEGEEPFRHVVIFIDKDKAENR